jgi:hypothetical protein
MPKSEAKRAEWVEIERLAAAAGARWPELVAAQWALESAWGEKLSGANNPFGLKGTGTMRPTQEEVGGKMVDVQDEFKDFGSIAGAVTYLVSRWYQDYKGYQGVNRATSRNAAAHMLKEQGYATDSSYPTKLIRLMDENATLKAPATPASPPPAKAAAPLFHLEALGHTWLKKAPKQAGELPANQRVKVAPGHRYGVLRVTECPADAHMLVELAGEAGSWYVWQPHWKLDQLVGEALPREVDWSDFGCPINEFLTVGEVLQWDARRRPASTSADIARILGTAEQFLAIRKAWGGPLGVTSFYRPEPINTEVGGERGSFHIRGVAMDIYPVGRGLEEFHRWIRNRWTGGFGDGRPKGFIHLDRRANGHFVPGAGVSPWTVWTY